MSTLELNVPSIFGGIPRLSPSSLTFLPSSPEVIPFAEKEFAA